MFTIKKSTMLIFLLSMNLMFAQAPMMINYQGKLNMPGMATKDSTDMTFIIYEDSFSITQPVWSKEYNNVQLSNGIFTVLLGPFTPEVFNGNGERWLEVNAGSQRLLPRYRLVSVPYAMYSNSARMLSAADGNPLEAVIVDAVGSVGIGTPNPIKTLHLNSGKSNAIVVENSYANNANAYALLDNLSKLSYIIGGPWYKNFHLYWKDQNDSIWVSVIEGVTLSSKSNQISNLDNLRYEIDELKFRLSKLEALLQEHNN